MKTATGIELSKALELLAVDFPQCAIKERTGSGGKLSSISPAYEIERLNDVFGLCGFGWRYSFTDFKEYPGEGKISLNIIVKVTLEFYVTRDDGSIGHDKWSNPITAIGQGSVHAGMSVGDAHKSAVTDGLTKAASMIGVGISVFKGEQTHESRPVSPPTRQDKQAAASKKADATAKPKQKSYRDNPGWTVVDGFEQSGSDMVSILAEYKKETAKSILFAINGKDVFMPKSNVDQYSATHVHCTEWIAYKKVEAGDIPEKFIVRISEDVSDRDPDSDYDEPPPYTDDDIPM